MKIYTEEQLLILFAKTLENAPSAESHTRMISDSEYRHFIMDEMFIRIMEYINPIELPSDEEIEKWAKIEALAEPTGAEEFGRIYGAKWMREKITKTK